MSKETTRQNILETALQLFSTKGYSSITTKEIAKKAGISEMTVFRHFDTKRSIFTSVIQELMYAPEMERIHSHQFTWNLKEDLTMIS
ncbi:MAG: helix-turn-helix transcriptional regulator, partial [Spirochaetales bacterium]|nr:helix-turn-helix transcriptional regulator [Spirochaetales bacterium]